MEIPTANRISGGGDKHNVATRIVEGSERLANRLRSDFWINHPLHQVLEDRWNEVRTRGGPK